MICQHLLPNIQDIALLCPEARIHKLHNDFWIEYHYAEQVLKKLRELLLYPKRVRMPNMFIISPMNNGKTMILEKFKRNHLPYSSENGEHEIIPVLMIQMPSNPTLQRFYSAIIKALSSPVCYSSTNKYETMVIKLLEVTQTKILIIDELHNMLAGNRNKQREFLNVLRFLGNKLKISIVGAGIKDAYLAIRSDDQLENRFEPFILPLWKNDGELMRLLASFEKVLPLRKQSKLTQVDIRTIILERSEGTIGEISRLLTQAACHAIESRKELIDLEVLENTDYRSPSERRRLYESLIH